MRRRNAIALASAAACGFLAGMVTMAALVAMDRAAPPSREPHVPVYETVVPDHPVAPPPRSGDDTAGAVTSVVDRHLDPVASLDDAIEELRRRRLDVPLLGVDRDDLRSSFDELRAGARRHEAMDLLAPRNTPVIAVEAGVVARLFLSRAGGITVYQFDPTSTFAYYYAHLERYADGLAEGDHVERGQVIGYVGTSGNASEDTPHLHFAIFRLTEDRHWWEGTPIDPFLVLR